MRSLSKTTLPTNEDVLRRLMHLRFVRKLTIIDSIDHLVEEVMSIWNNLCVMTRAKVRVKIVLRKLYNEYHMVKKNKARRTAAQIKRETNLKLKFPALCEIAHEGNFILPFLYSLIFFLLQYSTQLSTYVFVYRCSEQNEE